MLKTLVLAALMATLTVRLAAQTRWAAGEGESPRVGIFIDFDLKPSQSSLAAMQREVGALMALAGAQLSWVMMKTQTASETFDELAVLRFRGSCRAAKPGASPIERLTLGSTEVAAGGVTSYGSVECDQIQSCLSGMLGTFSPSDRDEAFGRALGRVVSHELYHIIGRTTEHSHTGFSKSLQTPFDLVRRDFQVDRQTIVWLRELLKSKKDRGGSAALLLPIRPRHSIEQVGYALP